MVRSLACAGALLSLSCVLGCGSNLTAAGQEVRVATEPQKESCVEIDSEATSSVDALEDRLVMLRNRAGNAGANYLVKTSKPENVGGTPLYIWRAYRCPTGNGARAAGA